LLKEKTVIRRLSVVSLAIVAMVFGANVVCLAQPQSLLTRHVREVTLNGEAPSVGRLPANQSLRVDIVLQMRDPAGLDGFLKEVYDPSSPSYRQFLSVERFTERFGPSQQDFDALIRFAKTNGFSVTGGSRDAMDVQLRGTVAAIETAFNVRMGLYHDPIENRDFYAPDREPTVDLPFRLWHIRSRQLFDPAPRTIAETCRCEAPGLNRFLPGSILLRQRHASSLLRGNCAYGQGPEHRPAGVRWV
jgi:Pro-kumamolisin, activation domain